MLIRLPPARVLGFLLLLRSSHSTPAIQLQRVLNRVSIGEGSWAPTPSAFQRTQYAYSLTQQHSQGFRWLELSYSSAGATLVATGRLSHMPQSLCTILTNYCVIPKPAQHEKISDSVMVRLVASGTPGFAGTTGTLAHDHVTYALEDTKTSSTLPYHWQYPWAPHRTK